MSVPVLTSRLGWYGRCDSDTVYGIYGLVRKMPKEEFLGISARLFLFVNLFKVPFNAQLEIITAETLKLDLALLPGILIGVLIGKRL